VRRLAERAKIPLRNWEKNNPARAGKPAHLKGPIAGRSRENIDRQRWQKLSASNEAAGQLGTRLFAKALAFRLMR